MTEPKYPFRLLVQHRITDALKTITPANGYVVDLSGDDGVDKVFRGRSVFGQNDPFPLISVLQIPKTSDPVFDTPADSSISGNRFILAVQGWADDDRDNPTDGAEVLLADVRKRLLLEKTRKHPTAIHQNDPFGLGVQSCRGLGNAIVDLSVGNGLVRPPEQQVSDFAFFWLELSLTLAEDGLQPYNLPN